VLLEPHTRTLAVVAIEFVMTSAIIAVGYVVLIFYWRGRNWARWLVMFSCLLCFWNLRGLPHRNLLLQCMLVAEAILAMFLLYWLNTGSARAFFSYRRVQPTAEPQA
jgi:hypothetical protein